MSSVWPLQRELHDFLHDLSFPPTEGAVYLCCVAIINLSCEYEHMLSLVNSSIDTLNVWVVTGPPKPVYQECLHKWCHNCSPQYVY